MKKLDKPKVEIALGVFLMVLSFTLSFLMVINVIKLDSSMTIVLSFVLYSLSLIGLIIGLHGIHEMMILLERKKKSER